MPYMQDEVAADAAAVDPALELTLECLEAAFDAAAAAKAALLHEPGAPAAFDTAKTKAEVLAAAGPFIRG